MKQQEKSLYTTPYMEVCDVEIEQGFTLSDDDQLEDGDIVDGEW